MATFGPAFAESLLEYLPKEGLTAFVSDRGMLHLFFEAEPFMDILLEFPLKTKGLFSFCVGSYVSTRPLRWRLEFTGEGGDIVTFILNISFE